jgi:hypothetical protein
MRTLAGIVILAVLVAATAASAALMEEEITYSGFLKDYSRLEKGPEDGIDRRYVKKKVYFRKYEKIMMDHVVFYFKKDAESREIDPQELKELADAFHKKMADALLGAYPMVSEPGPDVMRVRFAITELEPTTRGLNTITTVVPIGLAVSVVKKGVTGSATFVGGVTMEVEILDSVTGERLAAGVDSRSGQKYKVTKGVTKWGLVEEIFEDWAEKFKDWLDVVHGR